MVKKGEWMRMATFPSGLTIKNMTIRGQAPIFFFACGDSYNEVCGQV